MLTLCAAIQADINIDEHEFCCFKRYYRRKLDGCSADALNVLRIKQDMITLEQ